MLTNADFTIETLGKATIESSIQFSSTYGDRIANFVADDEYAVFSTSKKDFDDGTILEQRFLMEKAGPRKNIYFSPSHVHAGIMTCGGLCPGLNDVIRSIVRALWHIYGVRRISGIRYGYKGLLPEYNYPLLPLDIDNVDDIHNLGGTILGTARGGGDEVEKIVDSLERLNMNLLFVIGGDGTLRGGRDIAAEIKKRGLKIAVIGIPKTIDNDLSFLDKSFGFDTAVAQAVLAVNAAHTEAKAAVDGVGLVRVMGRHSGFIAAYTTLSTSDVNFCLIPEVPFDLKGEKGLFAYVERRLDRRGHAVILVAEGAGQEHLEAIDGTDASGHNKKLADIGVFLKEKIVDHLKSQGREANLKYIDPSYMIRAQPASPNDSLYCARLGANAVHAAMSGRTSMLVSEWNNVLVHIPISMAVSRRNTVDPESSLWRDVLESTRQPIQMKN